MSDDVREQERRKPTIFSLISIMEAVIIAGLVAMGTLIFQTREAVVKLTVQMEILQSQLADVPELTTRMSRAEVRIERLEKDVDEVRDMRGLQ